MLLELWMHQALNGAHMVEQSTGSAGHRGVQGTGSAGHRGVQGTGSVRHKECIALRV